MEAIAWQEELDFVIAAWEIFLNADQIIVLRDGEVIEQGIIWDIKKA